MKILVKFFSTLALSIVFMSTSFGFITGIVETDQTTVVHGELKKVTDMMVSVVKELKDNQQIGFACKDGTTSGDSIAYIAEPFKVATEGTGTAAASTLTIDSKQTSDVPYRFYNFGNAGSTVENPHIFNDIAVTRCGTILIVFQNRSALDAAGATAKLWGSATLVDTVVSSTVTPQLSGTTHVLDFERGADGLIKTLNVATLYTTMGNAGSNVGVSNKSSDWYMDAMGEVVKRIEVEHSSSYAYNGGAKASGSLWKVGIGVAVSSKPAIYCWAGTTPASGTSSLVHPDKHPDQGVDASYPTALSGCG
jgi:hypothetical protein